MRKARSERTRCPAPRLMDCEDRDCRTGGCDRAAVTASARTSRTLMISQGVGCDGTSRFGLGRCRMAQRFAILFSFSFASCPTQSRLPPCGRPAIGLGDAKRGERAVDEEGCGCMTAGWMDGWDGMGWMEGCKTTVWTWECWTVGGCWNCRWWSTPHWTRSFTPASGRPCCPCCPCQPGAPALYPCPSPCFCALRLRHRAVCSDRECRHRGGVRGEPRPWPIRVTPLIQSSLSQRAGKTRLALLVPCDDTTRHDDTTTRRHLPLTLTPAQNRPSQRPTRS